MCKRSLAVGALLVVATGCPQPSQDQEADTLHTRSTEIHQRAAMVAADLDELTAEVADWRQRYQISAATGDILSSLLAHPLGLHVPQEQADPDAQAYARLEGLAADFKAAQRAVETDWGALTADVDAWAQRYSISFEEFSVESQFTVGEPLPSGPGIAFVKKPCPMTVTNSAGRICHLVEEHCIKIGRQNGHLLWSQVCRYRCTRFLNPFNKPGPSPIARLDGEASKVGTS